MLRRAAAAGGPSVACHPASATFRCLWGPLLPAGDAFLSHTRLGGRYVIRCAIGGTHTQGQHVEAAWRAVQRCATGVLAAAAQAAQNGEAAGGV